MNSYELAAVVGFASAVVGAAASAGTAWLAQRTQRRRESGTVQTSDAQTLFSASNQLIQMLLTTTQTLTQRLDDMVARFEQLAERVDRLVQQQDEILRLQREQTRTLHSIENGGKG